MPLATSSASLQGTDTLRAEASLDVVLEATRLAPEPDRRVLQVRVESVERAEFTIDKTAMHRLQADLLATALELRWSGMDSPPEAACLADASEFGCFVLAGALADAHLLEPPVAVRRERGIHGDGAVGDSATGVERTVTRTRRTYTEPAAVASAPTGEGTLSFDGAGTLRVASYEELARGGVSLRYQIDPLGTTNAAPRRASRRAARRSSRAPGAARRNAPPSLRRQSGTLPGDVRALVGSAGPGVPLP